MLSSAKIQDKNKHHITLNLINLSDAESKTLYDLILKVPYPEKELGKSNILEDKDNIYNLTLNFSVRIIDRQDNKIKLEVFEKIDPKTYYQTEIQSNKDDLDFSFLSIYKVIGHLNLSLYDKKKPSYQENIQVYIKIECHDELDPTNASLAQRIFLDDMFETIFQTKTIDQHKVVTIKNGYLPEGSNQLELITEEGTLFVSVKLKSVIALRNSARYSDEYRADIESSLLGVGTYARVTRLLGTFKHAKYKKNDNKVLKDFVVNADNANKYNSKGQTYVRPDLVLNEVDIGGSIEHLHTSKPICIKRHGEDHWQLRENYLSGIDLYDLMDNYPIKTQNSPLKNNEISIDGYLELFYEAALALLQQFHFRGIVHRDLKPENIRIDMGKHMQCYICDTNLSKKITTDDSDKVVGTATYISPEATKNLGTSHKSDVFSLMRFLVLVFEISAIPNNQWQNPKNYTPNFPYLTEIVNNKLIDVKHADNLKKIFTRAFEFNPVGRCNVEDILEVFDNIIWERSQLTAQKTMSKKAFDNFRFSHDEAKKIRQQLLAYTKSTTKDKEDIYLPVLISDIDDGDLPKLLEDITVVLSKLENDKDILSEFCRTSGIRAIRDMTDKKKIENYISNKIHDYIHQVHELKSRKSQLADSAQYKIDNILNLRRKYSYSLDNIINLENIFSKAILKLDLPSPRKRVDPGLFKSCISSAPISSDLTKEMTQLKI